MNRRKGIIPRKEKIRLLQNIERGTVNINDLLSKKLDIHVGYGNGNEYFINGHPVSENAFRAEEKRQEFTNPEIEIEVGYGPEIDSDFDDEEND